MPMSSETTNGDDVTPADDQQVNSLEDGNGQNDGDIQSLTDQQLVKEFRRKFAKMEMELKDSKQLCMTKDIEIKVLQAELRGLREQKVMADCERNELRAKVAKLEQKQQQYNKGLRKLILARIDHLEEQQQMSSSKNVSDQQQLNSTSDRILEKKNYNISPKQKKSKKNGNCWNANACHYDLAISGPKRLMVHYKGQGQCKCSLRICTKNGQWWHSVYAKHAITHNNSAIFYFELTVKSMKAKGATVIGLAGLSNKKMQLDRWVGYNSDGYGYLSNGEIWSGGYGYAGNGPFFAGDTVGCGVHLATRQLFFTKNGHRLDDANYLSLFASPPRCSPALLCSTLVTKLRQTLARTSNLMLALSSEEVIREKYSMTKKMSSYSFFTVLRIYCLNTFCSLHS